LRIPKIKFLKIIIELQIMAAKMMGKEAALYVPSGTMSNLIALLVHCKQRGSEALVGDESHILHYENTGAAQVFFISFQLSKLFYKFLDYIYSVWRHQFENR